MADIPSPMQVETFLNVTKSYEVKKTMDGVTQYSDKFREIQTKIHEFADKHQGEIIEKKIKYQSKDEMIKVVLDFYRQLDSSLYDKINGVLNDYMITKNIELIDEGRSSGKCTPEGDRLNLEIHATKDASGIVAIAQELANAAVYKQYFEKKRIEDKQRAEFVAKAAKKFMAHLMIDFLAKNSQLSPQEIERLQVESLRDMSNNISSLECDQIIFDQMYQDNPEAFANNLENYTPDNFYSAMTKWQDNPRSMEVINNRIKDIGEKGETQHYLMGSILSELTALKLNEQFHINGNQTISNLLNGIENNLLLSQITGMTNADLINNGGNLVQHVNEQTMENANEQEQVFVMERKRIITGEHK